MLNILPRSLNQVNAIYRQSTKPPLSYITQLTDQQQCSAALLFVLHSYQPSWVQAQLSALWQTSVVGWTGAALPAGVPFGFLELPMTASSLQWVPYYCWMVATYYLCVLSPPAVSRSWLSKCRSYHVVPHLILADVGPTWRFTLSFSLKRRVSPSTTQL